MSGQPARCDRGRPPDLAAAGTAVPAATPPSTAAACPRRPSSGRRAVEQFWVQKDGEVTATGPVEAVDKLLL